MNKFHFGRQMEICGKVYDVDFGREEVKRVLDKLPDEIKSSNGDSEALVKVTKETIDTLFGQGTFDEIFADRIIRAADITHLLLFIKSEVEADTRGE